MFVCVHVIKRAKLGFATQGYELCFIGTFTREKTKNED